MESSCRYFNRWVGSQPLGNLPAGVETAQLLNSSSPERIFDAVQSFAKSNKITISSIRSIDSIALDDSVETKLTTGD